MNSYNINRCSKILLTLIFAILSISLYCQNGNKITFEYSYDAAGNRTVRAVMDVTKSCVIDTTKNNSETDEISEDDWITEKSENYEKFEKLETRLADIRINLYPNPVREQLHVEINGLQDSPQILYQVIDMNGRTIESNSFRSEKTDINFHDKQAGVYILRLLINGKYNEYKVVKN